MMTFSPSDLSDFFAARSRANLSAEAVIADLEARKITGSPTVRLATVRAVCDHVAQRAGRNISDLSAHEMAPLLAAGWGK